MTASQRQPSAHTGFAGLEAMVTDLSDVVVAPPPPRSTAAARDSTPGSAPNPAPAVTPLFVTCPKCSHALPESGNCEICPACGLPFGWLIEVGLRPTGPATAPIPADWAREPHFSKCPKCRTRLSRDKPVPVCPGCGVVLKKLLAPGIAKYLAVEARKQGRPPPKARSNPPHRSALRAWLRNAFIGLFTVSCLAVIVFIVGSQPPSAPEQPVPTSAKVPATARPPEAAPSRTALSIPPTSPPLPAPAQVMPPVDIGERPPPGDGRRYLTRAQVRYCVVARIRIDAVRAIVDRSNPADVARFEAVNSEYNSDCGKFNHDPKTVDYVKIEVAAFETEIRQQAVASWK